jgi:hypothetical protein
MVEKPVRAGYTDVATEARFAGCQRAGYGRLREDARLVPICEAALPRRRLNHRILSSSMSIFKKSMPAWLKLNVKPYYGACLFRVTINKHHGRNFCRIVFA